MDYAAIIRRDAGPLADRVEFIPDAPLSVIDETKLGILFVMAFWSGGSRQSFAKLVRTIKKLDPDGRLRFVVVDTDHIPHFYESAQFAGHFHGWGEAFWIKEGVVVSHSGVGLNLDCIEPNTLDLLGR